MKTNKTLIQSVKSGFKKGWETPTLPAHILELEKNTFIRLLRVIGSLSVGVLLYQKYQHLPVFVIFLAAFISSIFAIYQIVITIIRLKHMWKVLLSKDLDIKN